MEERRRNSEVQFEVMNERLNNFIDVRYAEDQKHSEEWRTKFCHKLDRVMDKIDTLPCPTRIEHTKNINFQLKALWAVTGGMVLAILSEWVRLK